MKYFRPVTIPPDCPPVLRQIMEDMNEQTLQLSDICKATGISQSTIWSWINRQASPRLHLLEALANAVGRTLTTCSTESRMGRTQPRSLSHGAALLFVRHRA